MKKAFHRASYLAQVRRLRSLAKKALALYPIQVVELHFINHGENTTFRVTARDRQKYLLRIHRDGYHSQAAIEEELAWLALLAKNKFPVPSPVRSRQGKVIQTLTHPDIPNSRFCCLFRWLDGGFVNKKSISEEHLYHVGQLLAKLQMKTPKKSVQHRRYWSAEGLVGSRAKFGSIDDLPGLKAREQREITRARKIVLAKLKKFERRFPERQGLIHADLHFGNILARDGNVAAIDFDDCGFGFHAYDLVIPMMSAEGLLGEAKKDQWPQFKKALLAGYTSLKHWDDHDEKIFPYLVTARRFTMLGWLNSRSDNPRLKKYRTGAVKSLLKHLRREYSPAKR